MTETKYKTEKRKANVGERILITNAVYSAGRYKNGDVLKVTHCTENGVRAGFIHNIWRGEYEVIVEEHTPIPNLDEMDCDELVALSESVMEALRKRSYKNGYDQGRIDVEIEAPESDQQKRDEIVAQAKEDVRELLNSANGYDHEFIVNSAKRAVVYLRKVAGRTSAGLRGIAKCSPNDCFNAHIGKAIALRRALRLEVPTEYLNVPQPTEIRVGDYVEHFVGTEPMVVSSEDKFPTIDNPFIGLAFVNEYSRMFKITDDSRAGEGE
ncbi:hypothetical protein HKK70_08975 [Bacillus safensis]|uniref:hypothetical protein n=1 Tax=Bacillus safensis TaxID=561879 RepID=UPI00146DBBFC|nr:hypothetical protein [Bacillus safensis]MCM3365975.1 hypothetical protein [Bacillus safensis]NMW01897.1 hypothetical protein [Bacillus safensis]